MSEYQIKREAVREYEDALRLKRAYSEGIEVCSTMIRGLVAHYESQGMPIPIRIRKFMLSLLREVETVMPIRLNVPKVNRDNDEPPSYQSRQK